MKITLAKRGCRALPCRVIKPNTAAASAGHRCERPLLQCPHALTPHQAVENVACGVRVDRDAARVRAELRAGVSICG